jgi:electron transport complex protein RnfC
LNQIIKNFPGVNSETELISSDKAVDSIVIAGIDSDLLISNNQYVVKSMIKEIKAGISFIEKATGINNFTIIVPEIFAGEAQAAGVSVKTVKLTYPNASPMLIVQNIMGRNIIAGKAIEDVGVMIINAETVAAIGAASTKSDIPDSKIITVIDKNQSTKMVSAIIGTPINTILSQLKIDVNEGDRIITGGPLTGTAIYSELYPVLPDTEAIMIQDRGDLPEILDNACINCGECIRVCPVKVPVNLLIRFLENGEYDEAADNYDLFSCIDCGLCAYVCQAKIPVFQYIKLAKHELARNNTVEAENA